MLYVFEQTLTLASSLIAPWIIEVAKHIGKLFSSYRLQRGDQINKGLLCLILLASLVTESSPSSHNWQRLPRQQPSARKIYFHNFPPSGRLSGQIITDYIKKPSLS